MPGAVSERIPVAISWESIKSIVLSGDHCGTEPLPRTAVKKKIWAYIKKHKLQNPKNKREILADEKLQPIFGSKKLDMFQMTKAVNKHLK